VRAFRRDERGLSEIVGALLLVLVVVSASAAFALFVNDRQKAIQEQQLLETQRSLEDVGIVSLRTVQNGSFPTWDVLNFTITSEHTATSWVTSFRINGHVVRQWETWRFNASTLDWESGAANYTRPFGIAPREQLYVAFNNTTSFFEPGLNFSTAGYVEIEVITTLQNSFKRAFLPPSAVALVTTENLWNGAAFDTVVVLDATESEPEAGASIVAYSWNVTPDNIDATGRKARATFGSTGINHTITLTVTDGFGMKDTDTIVYFY
jgi:flagellin-like protein